MIATLWRLLTNQIDTNAAQDDAALREACVQARYGTDDGLARQAVAGTRGDYDRISALDRQLQNERPAALERVDHEVVR